MFMGLRFYNKIKRTIYKYKIRSIDFLVDSTTLLKQTGKQKLKIINIE